MSDPDIRARFRGRLGRFALDVEFSAPGRGVAALFGPSGCGKTTVLRSLAGLQRFADGYARVAGEVWQDGATFLPPHRRRIGYVFQDARLFPHLSVRRNLGFGAPKAPRPGAVGLAEAVELLALERLLDRSPRHLSGGERQRVALGRALLSDPDLLLMDEPMSALDDAAKAEILPFLERLHGRLALPTLYVTHDMAEVERLADHLLLMEAGRIVATGPLAALQSDPSLPLALRRDAAVSLAGRIEAIEVEDGLLRIAVRGAIFLVAGAGAVGERRRLRVVAGDVSLAREPPGPSSILNIARARVLGARAAEHDMILQLGLGEDGAGERVLSRITCRSFARLGLASGDLVYAQVKSVALARGA